MAHVILVYFCSNLYCPLGKLACLYREGDTCDLRYCAERNCSKECEHTDCLSAVCYSHDCKGGHNGNA